jgi:hypothetical protein
MVGTHGEKKRLRDLIRPTAIPSRGCAVSGAVAPMRTLSVTLLRINGPRAAPSELLNYGLR